MNLNLVVLAGRLAAPSERRSMDTGDRLTRYLVTVRSGSPERVDVIPVTQWHRDPDEPSDLADPGQRVWVVGSVQRRFREEAAGRRSRLEVVAHRVELRAEEHARGHGGPASGVLRPLQ